MPMPIWALTSWWNEVRGEEKWHLADERRDQLLPNNTCGMCRLFFRWTQKERGPVTILGPVLICLVLCVCSWWEGGKRLEVISRIFFHSVAKTKGTHTHTQALKSESGHMCVCVRALEPRVCQQGQHWRGPPLTFFAAGPYIHTPNCVTIFICASI